MLGSNEGDRLAFIARARRLINERVGSLVLTSSIYRSQAWGVTDQAEFLNQVVVADTTLAPEAILAATQAIEKELGRVRAVKWGPRTIDIDILYVADLVVSTPVLTIPHAHIASRRFTLLPLAEIAPQLRHPVLGRTQAQLLASCTDELKAEKVTSDDMIG